MIDIRGQSAYADESFHEAAAGGFYVLAAAILHGDAAEARSAMDSLRGNRRTTKLHWNEMDHAQQQNAARTVAGLDGFHIVTVGAPVPRRRQERARAMCLSRLITELHGYGVTTLHLEARTRTLDRRDVATAVGARFALPHGAAFRVEHTPGRDEPLLWVADIVAGAVRADHEGTTSTRRILDDCVYQIALDTGC